MVENFENDEQCISQPANVTDHVQEMIRPTVYLVPERANENLDATELPQAIRLHAEVILPRAGTQLHLVQRLKIFRARLVAKLKVRRGVVQTLGLDVVKLPTRGTRIIHLKMQL